MRTYTLPRPQDGDLHFHGEHLTTVDDREWLGITPNWWELSLFRTREGGFVLASVYYQNYPRGKSVYGAWELDSLEHVVHCLHRCQAPSMIAEALLVRTRRALQTKDHPQPPVCLRPDPDGQRVLLAEAYVPVELYGDLPCEECVLHA